MSSIERMIELARAHIETGKPKAAGVYSRMTNTTTPPPKSAADRLARGEAMLWYARDNISRSRHGAALDFYHDAIAADPLAVDYRIEMAKRALVPIGLYAEALAELKRAARIEPNEPEVWRLLGGVHHKLSNVADAIAAYDRQIELRPGDASALLDRATIALDTADYDTVMRCCWQVEGKMRPDALHCMAMVLYRIGEHEQAIEMYQRAIDDGCYDPDLARWNMSLALQSIGRYEEGWALHECRGQQVTDRPMARIMNRFVAPMFANQMPVEDGVRTRIHVHQEMGFGDVIAMARYLPPLAERGYDVRLEVADSLVELLKRSLNTDPHARVDVMPRSIDYPGAIGIPAFDFHIPMLSLPAILGTRIETIPWRGSYLRANSVLAAAYRGVLPANKKRIGFCWSSGIRTEGLWLAEYGRRKSIGWEWMRKLVNAARPDHCVSLQVGPERAEGTDQIHDVLPANPTWDDTAALVACLDLVITVDTSVAHLAGAMGKPVWLLMHTEGSWHWMAPREGAPWNERSPWYPTVMLFRQARPHEWGDVVEAVTRELRQPMMAEADRKPAITCV